MDVVDDIAATKKLVQKYFPDQIIATDKDNIFDCVAECFTQTNYFIYYVSLIIIVVMWISFHETSVGIFIYIIVILTLCHKTSVGIVIYMYIIAI